MLNTLLTLGDVIEIEEPEVVDAAVSSGNAVFLGIAAVLIVAVVAFIVISITKKSSK
ncbi:MAG: hypothetical protein IJV16_02240 [Lachnospiraceae bacterium]|nr:hypothetical protein [Lachnospiraceae bacterium]